MKGEYLSTIGYEALVFRLAFPPGVDRIATILKGKQEIDYILKNCEIGLLKRIA